MGFTSRCSLWLVGLLCWCTLSAYADELYVADDGASCRNEDARRYARSEWRTGNVNISGDFVRKICRYVATEKFESSHKLLEIEFSRLKGKTGFCYVLGDQEIYDKIDCSVTNDAYHPDLLVTAIRTGAVWSAHDLIGVLSAKNNLNRNVAGLGKSYHDYVLEAVESTKRQLAQISGVEQSETYEKYTDQLASLERIQEIVEGRGGEPLAEEGECRSPSQLTVGRTKWHQHGLSLTEHFNARVCEYLIKGKIERTKHLIKSELDYLKRESSICYRLGDAEIYDRIDCSHVDSQYPVDLLLALVKNRAADAAVYVIDELAKTQQLNRNILQQDKSYHDIVSEEVKENSDHPELGYILQHLEFRGGRSLPVSLKKCRGKHLMRKAREMWSSSGLTLNQSFSSRICSYYAKENLAVANEILGGEFSRLKNITKVCYQLGDSEIYDQIDCSLDDAGYEPDLLHTLLKERAEKSVEAVMVELAPARYLHRKLDNFGATYYAYLRSELEKNREKYTRAKTVQERNQLERDKEKLEYFLGRLEEHGGKVD